MADIRAKLPQLTLRAQRVVDIGSGCGVLPDTLIHDAEILGHQLTCIDSPEMLAALPASPALSKVAAEFPHCPEFITAARATCNAVLAYSMFHYVFEHGNPWGFVDAALTLLAPGGRLLLGDVPNRSKRDRFLASEVGRRLHKAHGGSEPNLVPRFNQLVPAEIDDAVLWGLAARARAAGFDAYILPQPEALPLADRREDLLFVRP